MPKPAIPRIADNNPLMKPYPMEVGSVVCSPMAGVGGRTGEVPLTRDRIGRDSDRLSASAFSFRLSRLSALSAFGSLLSAFGSRLSAAARQAANLQMP
jgi:hypothetical protein